KGKARFEGIPGMPLHTLMATTGISFGLAARIVKGESRLAKKFESEAAWARLTIETLLRAGALVSARGEDGQTPLHIAAKCNNLIGASMLIEAGAKIADKDNTGKTPLDYAESGEMIKLLKSYGAKEQ
ncbi:MAG: ankyrin repeat domain-containing protein, partial [Sedimentisphaerales bacterium]|nr:ankyrin repeat domain-containing protein [Sedimentisphaerales bacterium]